MIDESTYRTLDAIASRLFKAGVFPRTVQNADVAFAVILAGHELGFAPMASVRGITLVNGKVSLGADATVAVCTRHRDVCGYFSCVESTDERAEYVTHRVGAPAPVTLSYTIAQAKRAGLTSNATWRTHTEAMLRARCAAALARSVYPDLVAGVYDPDEAAEIRGDHATATDVRPTAEVKPEPLALPRDNGLPPSQAAAPRPLSAAEHAAMVDTVRGAKTREDLDREVADLADDAARGTDAQRSELRAAIIAARKALAAPSPSDDPPPDGPTKPRGRPRKATQGDAASDSSAATPGASTAPQGGPAAWLMTEEETTAHAATLLTEWAVQASARKHNAALASTPWGVRVYAQRLQAMGVGTEAQCARYVSAWCHHGPKAAATAQRRAA
jgi:hypothetical protein